MDWRLAKLQHDRPLPRSCDLLHGECLVLLGVLHEGRGVSMRALAARTGLSLSTVYVKLGVLKTAGLVDYDPGRRGTTRPAVRPVPFGGAHAG